MGAEDSPTLTANHALEAPLVLGLQSSALVDHVARVDWSLLDSISCDRGGSIPVCTYNLVFQLRCIMTGMWLYQILSLALKLKLSNLEFYLGSEIL